MQLSELYLMEAWNWKQFARGAATGAALGAAGMTGAMGLRGDSKPKSEPSPKVREHEPEPQPRKIQAIKPKVEPKSEPKVAPKPEPKVEPKPESKPESKPNQLTVNFNLSEFASKDGSKTPPQVAAKLKELARNLQVLRDIVGPISLTSGYRSPRHNASVGGASSSQHVQGTAADIKVPGMSPKKVHALIEKLIAEGKMTQGGLGLYKSFVHYDIRGTRARWSK